jgi:hypothetical protein
MKGWPRKREIKRLSLKIKEILHVWGEKSGLPPGACGERREAEWKPLKRIHHRFICYEN